MAYDPLAALANSSTVMRRPMAQGGYPTLSYDTIQNGMRRRRGGPMGVDQYGAEPGSYAASTPYRPNDAFDQWGNDTTVKGYTPPVRPNDAFDQWGNDTTVKGYTPPQRPNDAFDQWGRDTTVKGYSPEPPRRAPPRPRPPLTPRSPYRGP